MCHDSSGDQGVKKLENEFLQYALDFGAVGIMAYIFFWLYMKQGKKLEELLSQQKIEEDKIRERFSVVINKYDTEKELLMKERLESLVKLKNEIYNLKELHKKQDSVMLSMIEEIKLLRTEISVLNRK